MEYVEARDGNFYIGKSRVTLDSIIIYWQMGSSPEQLHESFPTVPLAAVYGTIAYYLEHQAEVDQYLRENEALREKLAAEAEAAHPEFYAKMRQRLAEARKRHGLEGPNAITASDESSSGVALESPTV